ncbi:MAG: mannose-1-phosphate guanylyltransferase/mannose-6-phosphate isomerase [Azoarcus sp.]|jgi:mannose-1-phosphate guanylyltransferase/mannose-6-phosphate isomerase|nr:mannose-1-phosphate guanylyltransferase/mannose-6-phosphate isomerase [Azoarcus sp.]
MTIKQVILSGGAGTRLWPVSRETYPKQLLPLTGERSLLQETAMRLEGYGGPGDVDSALTVVSNEEYRFIIAEQLRQMGVGKASILLEPIGRNTAPALTLAALEASAGGEDPVLLVMPADHVIEDRAAFQRAIAEGVRQAESGALVCFGVVPKRAETGYGYLRAGEVASGGARELLEFVEKPDAQTAERYVASGAYFWNCGIFMFRASVWQAALARFRPDIDRACREAFAGREQDADFLRVSRAEFEACPSDSIDYAVMEKLRTAPELGRGVIVPLATGWSDVGAWDALWAVSKHDADGNASRGDVIFQDSRNTLVYASHRLVAAVGCEDMVVAETADAVLVVPRSRAQDVKKAVSRITAEGRSHGRHHRKVFRPWGWYDSIDSGDRFQVKRIVVNPGASLSLQMHYHRAEHWIVVRGTAEVQRGDEVLLLGENESAFIPLGVRHRLHNPGHLPLEIIEVQSGSYLGEDDIVRFDDVYGRTVLQKSAPKP